MKNPTMIGTLALVAAIAAGFFAVGPAAIRLANTSSVAPDADADTVPDNLETELCDRAITSKVIQTAQVGRCVSSKDWLPPNTAQRVFLPTKILMGPDEDQDGLPATIQLLGQDAHIDPFSKEKLVLRPSAGITIQVDSAKTGDDHDNQVPILSSARLPTAVPLGIEELRDGDRDDLPSAVQIKMVFVTIDRSHIKGVATFEDAPDVTVQIDVADDDPTQPVTHQVNVPYVPTDARHDGDADDDLIPHALTISYVNVTVDRRVQAGSKVTERFAYTPASLTQVLDVNDAARDNIITWSIVDKDADRVPDKVEAVFCLLEKESDPADGSCDAADQDYAVATGAKNPWNSPSQA